MASFVKCMATFSSAGVAGSFLDPYLRNTDNNIFFSPTVVKAKRVALFVLGFGIPLSTASCIKKTPAILISSALGAQILYYSMHSTYDYSDSKELKQIRKNAEDMTWQQLLKAHGIHILFAYRILTKDAIQGKFENAHHHIAFSELPLAQIKEYDLASVSFLKKAFTKELSERKIEFLLNLDLENIKQFFGDAFGDSLCRIKLEWLENEQNYLKAKENLDKRYERRSEKRESLRKQNEDRIWKQNIENIETPASYEVRKEKSEAIDLAKREGIERQVKEYQEVLKISPPARRQKGSQQLQPLSDSLHDKALLKWLDDHEPEMLLESEKLQSKYNHEFVDLLHIYELKKINIIKDLKEFENACYTNTT